MWHLFTRKKSLAIQSRARKRASIAETVNWTPAGPTQREILQVERMSHRLVTQLQFAYWPQRKSERDLENHLQILAKPVLLEIKWKLSLHSTGLGGR